MAILGAGGSIDRWDQNCNAGEDLMEKTGVFDLIGQGFSLLRQHPVIYPFGLVVGAATAIPQGFAIQAISGITVDSPDSEITAAATAVGGIYVIFGFLFLLANAALWTFAARVAQGDFSVASAVERVRRRMWALVLYGPMISLALVVPFVVLIVLTTLVESAWPLLLLALPAFFFVVIVYAIGIWAVVPALTISDVRLREVFYVIWKGFRNGGLRVFGLGFFIGMISLVVGGVVGLVLPIAGPLGAGTVAAAIVSGFFASWSACSIGYLWIAESTNVVRGLSNTDGSEITEAMMIYPIVDHPDGFS